MSVLHFDEATHAYTLEGRRLPSVTQIIEPIRVDYSFVDRATLEFKRAFGVAVHKAVELDDMGELDDTCLDEAVAARVAAYRKFKAETGAVILAGEQKMHHPLGFAGTLDLHAFLPNVADENWIVDVKTADTSHPSYGVQTAGYALLLQAAGEPITDLRRGSLHLFSDGTYRLAEYKAAADFSAFLGCLSIHQWKESNK